MCKKKEACELDDSMLEGVSGGLMERAEKLDSESDLISKNHKQKIIENIIKLQK